LPRGIGVFASYVWGRDEIGVTGDVCWGRKTVRDYGVGGVEAVRGATTSV